MKRQNNVLEAGISLSEKLKEVGADVYLGVLPEIPGKEKTGADDFLVEYGAVPFRKWVESLEPFTHPELYRLNLLLYEISPDIPKEQILFALQPLLGKLAEIKSGLGEQYIETKIKSYFKLSSTDLDNLEKVLKDLRKQQGNQISSQENNSRSYFVDKDGCLCRNRRTDQGVVPVRLANFEAWISEERIEDNGVDLSHNYTIEGQMKDSKLPKIEIGASTFPSLSWLYKWGSKVILEPGQAIKDYVRHGIQLRSNPSKIVTYTHMGWREINGKWVYLTAGGAIGGSGISVKLPQELQRYNLPLIPENEDMAIRTSLSFLDIAVRKVTIPLFSLLYLSPLTTQLKPMPNFLGYLYGQSGVFKTSLAIISLSH